MKYYIIAGESSGDIYGGLLMKEIHRLDPQAQFRFWGGPKMKAHSSGQLKSLEDTAFMGFWEVAKNALAIRKLFAFAKYSIEAFKPDLVIFIDYPGFNLRMLKWAHAHSFKTCFYISPQLWAWKKKRHTLLRDFAHLFFVILPFEKNFYQNLDTPCIYHGHPLLEIVPHQKETISEIKTIGLLPGSRAQELEQHMPILMAFASAHPNYQFLIAGLSHLDKRLYADAHNEERNNVDIVFDNAQEVMQKCDLAISSSGTATLELALYGVPQIVIYKTSGLSFAIGKRLVKTEYISLVNIIAGKQVVDELLQDECTLEKLKASFEVLRGEENRRGMLADYKEIRMSLGDEDATQKVAEDIVNFLEVSPLGTE